MKTCRAYFIVIGMLLVICILARIPKSSYAQGLPSEISQDIPSDLSLDLSLAQQNPASEQQQIVSNQIDQAEVTTNSGLSIPVTPKDTVPSEIKIEKMKDAVNPEQTTSEQVISTPVTVPDTTNDQQIPSQTILQEGITGTPQYNSDIPTSATDSNFVPGTTIVEPDDNAAPPLPTPTKTADSQASNATTKTQVIPNEDGTLTGITISTPIPRSSNSSVQGTRTGPNTPWWKNILYTIFGSN